MTLLQGFWHGINFLMPAWAVALLMTGAIKLLWRQEALGRPWWALTLVGAGVGMGALVIGLMVTGQDGRLATYAAMLVAMTLSMGVYALHWFRR